jgi:hypothetical protein
VRDVDLFIKTVNDTFTIVVRVVCDYNCKIAIVKVANLCRKALIKMMFSVALSYWKNAGFLLLLALVSACQPLPPRGGNFVMVVKSVPTTPIQLQDRPELSRSLLRGVTRNDVIAGRLVLSHCYIRNETGIRTRRFGFVILPEGVRVNPGDIVKITAEEVIGGSVPFSRFFDNKEKLFECGPISPSGLMRTEVISLAHYWDFDFARAEELRNSGINEEELRNGRIVIGECSPGVDSWSVWKVRLRPDMDVKAGDYIEAIAGSYENSTSVGAISEALRKVASPDAKYFVKTQGRLSVSCDAPALPIEGSD